MKFLITGITGFVGTHLSNLLVKEGHEVFGIFRNWFPNKINNVKLLSCNLLDIERIYYLFDLNKFDGIFHLAGQTHIPTALADPLTTFKINTLGTIELCNATREHNPDCVIMQCSTGDVYGSINSIANESTSLNPNNPYAVSKAAADMFILERSKNSMLKSFIVRPYSHTGPGRPSNFSISSDAIQIARIIKGKQPPVIKVGNLNSKRAIIDVRDMVQIYSLLMTKAINKEFNSGEIFNICGDNDYTMNHYLNIMLTNYKLQYVQSEIDSKLYRPIDSPIQLADSIKIKKLLNYKYKYSIEQTLIDLVEFWLENEDKI